MAGSAASDTQATRAKILADRLRRAFFSSAFPDDLAHRGRWLCARCMIQIGDEMVVVQIEEGTPRLIENVPPLASWEFAIRGSVAAWSGHWENPPRPGHHDLFALTKNGEMHLEGNLRPLLANLQYIKDLVALPRTAEKT